MNRPPLKMPERLPTDGAVGVRIEEDGTVTLSVGEERLANIGMFNAWRLFGMLAIMLRIPLARSVERVIQIATPGVTFPDGSSVKMGFK